MSLFSPLFRSIDLEIATLERRIELRRSLIRAREHELHTQLVDTLTSPAAFAGAAALGFMLARGGKRAGAGARRRGGLLGRLGTIGVTLLQLRYGSPFQWIARILAGAAAQGRRAGRHEQ
ncbi:MAG: hypothetical protein JWN73_3832 [Betaproteobacteria bacterium]|nr:hypothetical protein [Betaproteobacteria bacterium]